MSIESKNQDNLKHTQSGYDQWAPIYDCDGNPLQALEQPRVRALLGDVKGKRVLDMGCGTGRHALWCAEQGATVTAIDFSQGMLDQAQQKSHANKVAWQAHNLHEPLPFEDDSFDAIVSGLVLEHIRDLDLFFHEAARVLTPGNKKANIVGDSSGSELGANAENVSGTNSEGISGGGGGRLIVSAMHPAMFLRQSMARFTDPDSGNVVTPGSLPHTIPDFLTAALNANLKLTHLSEHHPDTAFAQHYPRAEKYIDWPMLVVMGFEA